MGLLITLLTAVSVQYACCVFSYSFNNIPSMHIDLERWYCLDVTLYESCVYCYNQAMWKYMVFMNNLKLLLQ